MRFHTEVRPRPISVAPAPKGHPSPPRAAIQAWAPTRRRPCLLEAPRVTVVVAHAINCREIGVADIEAVIALLRRGFPICPPALLSRVFTRLTSHRTPRGFPRYGYLIEADGQP